MFRSVLRGAAAVAMLLAAGGVAAKMPEGDRPDFSGYWHLDKEKSKVSAETSTMWMKVEQAGSTLMENLRTFHAKGGEENQVFVYAMGGAESHNAMHGAPMKSTVERDGDTLAFHSVAIYGSDALKMEDRWSLSEDGATLTFREQSQFAQEAPRDALYVFTRSEAKEWPVDTTSEPVEKQFQNIRVLTGRHASELPAIMQGFARALGVACSHCHVPGEFERDDKPEKEAARRMIAMTAKLNAESIAKGGEVTCWMCHRGAATPEGAPK